MTSCRAPPSHRRRNVCPCLLLKFNDSADIGLHRSINNSTVYRSGCSRCSSSHWTSRAVSSGSSQHRTSICKITCNKICNHNNALPLFGCYLLNSIRPDGSVDDDQHETSIKWWPSSSSSLSLQHGAVVAMQSCWRWVLLQIAAFFSFAHFESLPRQCTTTAVGDGVYEKMSRFVTTIDAARKGAQHVLAVW